MNRIRCLAVTCIAFGSLIFGPPALWGTPPTQEGSTDPAVSAKDTQDEKSFATIKKEADKLQADLRKVMTELSETLQNSESDEARNEALNQYQQTQLDYTTNLVRLGHEARKLLEQDPNGEGAFAILRWLAGISAQDPDLSQAVCDFILAHQLQNEDLVSLLPQLAMAPQKSTIDFLETIANSDALPVIRAHATLQHLELLSRYRDQAQSLLKDPNVKLPEHYREFFESIAGETIEEIEQKYRNLGEKFGEVEYRNRTIAKLVNQALEAIEIQKNLQIGKVVPEIEGKDLDGVVFKLSDYRGKVVMLDFWGDW